jgi:hypothetical protein
MLAVHSSPGSEKHTWVSLNLVGLRDNGSRWLDVAFRHNDRVSIGKNFVDVM